MENKLAFTIVQGIVLVKIYYSIDKIVTQIYIKAEYIDNRHNN